MIRYQENDEDDEWGDSRDDNEADYDGDTDDEPTFPCPYCKEEILEDSPYCPHCEQYISEEEHLGPKKPLWVFLTALVCLGIAIWWVFAAF